jgi:hypothetical protein
MGRGGDEGFGGGLPVLLPDSQAICAEWNAADDYHDQIRSRDISDAMDFPFRFDGSGRTAAADDEEHIRI